MAHWASYIGFGFNRDESEGLLLRLRKELEQYDDYIAWHNPEYMHMTLQFLGWTKNSDVNRLKGILEKEKIGNINLKLNGKLVLLGFDSKKEYIAMEVEPTDELARYREMLGIRMKEQGIPFKKQDFISHISLGRVHNLNEIEDKQYFIPRIIQPNGVNVYESIPESSSLVSIKSRDLLLKDDFER